MSVAKDLQLIKLVKSNPILYDHNDPRYLEYNTREVVWHKIGDEMHRPASECKTRWCNIRDINRRFLYKYARDSGYSGKIYKYYNHLAFMKPYYKCVTIQNSDIVEGGDSKADINIDDDAFNDSSEDSEDDRPLKNASLNALPATKVKDEPQSETDKNAEITNSSETDSSDQVDAFLAGIASTLKAFSPYHLNLAKSQIFAVVQEHELQQIVKKSKD